MKIPNKCEGCKYLNGTVYDPMVGLFGGELFCESPTWDHSTDEFWEFESFMIYERTFKCPFYKKKTN